MLVAKFSAAVKDMLPYTQPRELELLPYHFTTGRFVNGVWVTDTEAFMKAIRDAAEREIGGPGRDLAREFAEMEFQQGIRYAEREIAIFRGLPLDTGIKIGGGRSPKEIEVLNRIISNNLIEIDKFTNDMATGASRAIREGLATGEGIRDIAKRIDEATEVGRTRAETIARTEVMYGINTSCRERMKSQGWARLERVESEDERTCTDFEFNVGGKIYRGCAAINGVIFTYEEAAQIDEQSHPNCRGTWIPAVPTDDETETAGAEG